jgi:hypothetical protein
MVNALKLLPSLTLTVRVLTSISEFLTYLDITGFLSLVIQVMTQVVRRSSISHITTRFYKGDCPLVINGWLNRVEDVSGLTFQEWTPDVDTSRSPVAMLINSSELRVHGFKLKEVIQVWTLKGFFYQWMMTLNSWFISLCAAEYQKERTGTMRCHAKTMTNIWKLVTFNSNPPELNRGYPSRAARQMMNAVWYLCLAIKMCCLFLSVKSRTK